MADMRMSRSSPAPATAGEVFALIRDGAVSTRADVGRVTGLSRTAVAARVSTLQARGLVLERAEAPSTGGRPPARLGFHPGARRVAAAGSGAKRRRPAAAHPRGWSSTPTPALCSRPQSAEAAPNWVSAIWPAWFSLL